MGAGLRCPRCGTGATPLAWRCSECGGALELDIGGAGRSLDPLALTAKPASGPAEGLWRYLPWLPISQSLSLGEATTPLVSIDWHGLRLTLKLEGSLPTGSFKDRGSAVMIRWLVTHGAPHVVIDSSGNAGASLAAYCSRAGLACHVFTPTSAAVAKLAQICAYGAILHKVEGNREQVTEAAMAWAPDGVYASHAWSALFLAGTESFAFEVWDQFSGDLPDAVVLPVGAGTLLLGAARGFASLRSSGLASQVPRIYGIQSTACAPLATAWAQGAGEPADVLLGDTIAEGICTRRPPRGVQIIDAVAASGGALVAADDEALLSAHGQLAERGVYAEYTSAIAAAGVTALLADGRLSQSDRVLVPISASGLKTAANSIASGSAKGRVNPS
jgi:threonine synthase